MSPGTCLMHAVSVRTIAKRTRVYIALLHHEELNNHHILPVLGLSTSEVRFVVVVIAATLPSAVTFAHMSATSVGT